MGSRCSCSEKFSRLKKDSRYFGCMQNSALATFHCVGDTGFAVALTADRWQSSAPLSGYFWLRLALETYRASAAICSSVSVSWNEGMTPRPSCSALETRAASG